jgi:hypothetical protein
MIIRILALTVTLLAAALQTQPPEISCPGPDAVDCAEDCPLFMTVTLKGQQFCCPWMKRVVHCCPFTERFYYHCPDENWTVVAKSSTLIQLCWFRSFPQRVLLPIMTR